MCIRAYLLDKGETQRTVSIPWSTVLSSVCSHLELKTNRVYENIIPDLYCVIARKNLGQKIIIHCFY